MKLQRFIWAAIFGGILSIAAVATASAHEDHSTSQWPTTCIDLNDIVETHLGNHGNVGIYQRTFGDQAETACQNDHRNDVRGVFAWAFDDASQSTQSDLPDLAWPTDCVELNDIVEGHVGNFGNVGIYQRVFGEQAEPACRNDHRDDVRAVFAWAFGGSAPSGAPAATSAPALPSRLAFTSDRHGNPEIYLLNAEETRASNITNDPALDVPSSWSPDGRRIAFHSNRDGDFEIYVMNADGSGLVQLTNNSVGDFAALWSPDGRRFAFTSDRDGDWEIYLVNADGTGLTRLTHDPAVDVPSSWSPDGSRLAFTSDRDGDQEIYLINADGTGLVQFTHNTDRDKNPVWSPDGLRLAFASDRDGDYEIYLINVDGTGLAQLTHNSYLDYNPTWSPDGRRLAFTAGGYWDSQIHIINADGTGFRRATLNPASDFAPIWGPLEGETDIVPPVAAWPLPPVTRRTPTAAILPLSETQLRIALLPWVLDGLNHREEDSKLTIANIALDSESLAWALLAKPWVQDGLTDTERWVVGALSFYVADWDPPEILTCGASKCEDEALRLVEMPFLETVEIYDALAFQSLESLLHGEGETYLRDILSHPALRDGITDDRAPVIAVLSLMSRWLPDRLDTVLNPDQTSPQKRTILLPLTGTVDLVGVQLGKTAWDPELTRAMDTFEHSVRTQEEFMGAPFPERQMLMFILGPGGYRGGAYTKALISFSNTGDHVIAHEVAHAYFSSPSAAWIREGAADFLARIVLKSLHAPLAAEPTDSCHGFSAIAELIRFEVEREDFSNYACHYALGEAMFLELYRRLGDEAFRHGFRHLHLLTHNPSYEARNIDDLLYWGPHRGLSYIKHAFVTNASPENAAIAEEIINRRYYGSSP